MKVSSLYFHRNLIFGMAGFYNGTSGRLTTVRLVTGAWLLLTLVLVSVYNGILISYVTAIRKAKPLISSVEDVVTDSSLHLVVDKGFGPDNVISVVFASTDWMIMLFILLMSLISASVIPIY